MVIRATGVLMVIRATGTLMVVEPEVHKYLVHYFDPGSEPPGKLSNACSSPSA